MKPAIQHITFVFIFSIWVTPMLAQTFGAFVRAGDKALAEKEYYTAVRHYEEALSISDNKPAVKFKYAEACRLLFAFEKAEKAYKDVIGSPGSSAEFPLARFWCGMVSRQLGNHDVAKKQFEKYLSANKNATGYYVDMARQQVLSCEFALSHSGTPENAEISWLDKSVNTPYSDFAATKIGDSLFYSSLRFNYDENVKGKEIKLSRLMISENGEKGRIVTGNANKEGFHTANAAYNPDGSKFFFTRCEGGHNEDIRCDIYVKEATAEGWTRPEALPTPINLEGFTSTHPAIGLNPENGMEVLYFVSDRPGGKGNLDIWYSEANEKGQFGPPVNAGETINSIGDEMSPSYSVSEDRLYFSSDWHPGFGGLDVFYIENSVKAESAPLNLGKPINSYNNDLYFSLGSEPLTAFLSSNRPGSLSLSEDYNCCYDIYKLSIFPPEEPPIEDPPTDTMPIVEFPHPEDPEITEVPPVSPPDNGPVPPLDLMLPITLYFHNDEPDSNSVKNTTAFSYDLTYAFYLSLKPTYLRNYGRDDQAATAAINDFFTDEVIAGYNKLESFVARLLTELETGRIIEVSIKGFTSPRAPTQYNYHLANRRISSMKNYFNRYRLGAFKPYLQSGQLKLVETPLGETTAPPGISDNYFDRRNSIYSPEASRERRIEITEIRFKD
ncbi:MAG: tetratricopeptide repeat protein [Bacteroidota bacterium]